MYSTKELDAMNQLCLQLERLSAAYGQFCQNSQNPNALLICKEALDAIVSLSDAADISLGTLCDSVRETLSVHVSDEFMLQIHHTLTSLLQKVQKMYAASVHSEKTYKHVLLKNYYQTSFSKDALLIYIVYPFLYPNATYGHTNQREAVVIAELLSEFGYNVDIINTHYSDEVDFSNYQLIIGSGKCFERALMHLGKDLLTIYYLTESSPYFANTAELKRLKAFERRNHTTLPFERQSANLLDLPTLSNASAAICLGNDVTLSTYEDMFSRIYPLNVSGFELDTIPDFSAEHTFPKNFMWYGGAGALHKGLDLCIEAFRQLPDLNLHIVGEPNGAFYDFYRKDIEQAPNIYYYGFLSKDDPLFIEACSSCCFCLLPSCSESQSTAMITAMFGGMIPVGTAEVGIDYEKCGGFLLDSLAPTDLAMQISHLASLDTKELAARREHAYQYVMQHHTLSHYRKELKGIFSDLLPRPKELKVQFLNGGLANQAFQYIFAHYYELSHPGEIMYLDDSYFALNTVHNGYELEKVFGIKAHMLSECFDADTWNAILAKKKEDHSSIPEILCENGTNMCMIAAETTYQEFNPFSGNVMPIPSGGYFPEILDYPGNVYYHGYWINKNWFRKYQDIFLQEFHFPEITDEKNRAYLEQIRTTDSVSIHIRRGDYVTLDWALQTSDYCRMIDIFLFNHPGNWSLFVFSDDINWCKDNAADLGFENFADVIYVEGNTQGKNYIDMQLMSQCKGMILSNSAFCYLAALLNTNLTCVLNLTKREL